MNPLRKTKIICTIGPSTSSFEMLMGMYKAGMNVVRLNMSHGSHDTHLQVIRQIKSINQKIKDSIPILLDLEGPEIRTGTLKNDLKLKQGDIITVSVGNEDVEISSFSINYEDLINTLNEGDKITVKFSRKTGVLWSAGSLTEGLSKAKAMLTCRVYVLISLNYRAG